MYLMFEQKEVFVLREFKNFFENFYEVFKQWPRHGVNVSKIKVKAVS